MRFNFGHLQNGLKANRLESNPAPDQRVSRFMSEFFLFQCESRFDPAVWDTFRRVPDRLLKFFHGKVCNIRLQCIRYVIMCY